MKRIRLGILIAIAVLAIQSCAVEVSAQRQETRRVRAIMLDPAGVVMAGYTNVPYLRGVGSIVGIDMDYWAINDRTHPTVFIVSAGAVSESLCIQINPAYVGSNYLPSRQVCGLSQIGGDSDCTLFEFEDPIYGRGVIGRVAVPLRWHLPFEQQALVSDCLAEAIPMAVEEVRASSSAMRTLQDYVRSSGE